MKQQPDPQPASRAVCHKLECIGEFLESYAKNINPAQYCYLELFARPFHYTCKETGVVIPNTSRRAFTLKPPFSHYILATRSQLYDSRFEKPEGKTSVINENIIYDCTLQRIFDSIPRSKSIFCIIDPPGYRCLRWTTVKKLITYGTNWQGHRMDMLLFLPVERALLKNITRPECKASITRFFGSSGWEDIRDEIIAGQTSSGKALSKLGHIYISGLKRMGYRHVDGFTTLKTNSKTLYFIIWASDRESRLKTIKSIWNKARFLPGEMFHHSS